MGLLIGAEVHFLLSFFCLSFVFLLSFFCLSQGGDDDNWVAHMDPETRKKYYANETTGHSTWTEHPQRV